LYQTFGGKQALFERCMTHYGDSMASQLLAGLKAAPSGLAFIRGFLESVLSEARGECEARGCLILNTANEFARTDPRIAEGVAQGLSRIHRVFLEAVQRAQKGGDIAPDRDPTLLVNFLISNMSGLKTLSKAGADESSLQGIIELVMEALK
jgi:TetR/AcrR family transcriptional repressor of nem operon